MSNIIQEIEKRIWDESIMDGYIMRCESAIALMDCLSTYMNKPMKGKAYDLCHWPYMESYGWFIWEVMNIQKEAKFSFDIEVFLNQYFQCFPQFHSII